MNPKIERALFAVSDKTGVAEFARGLAELGVEILSTGGTARVLKEAGVPVREVADVTEFPEMMGGRVKTLHPRVHGGILARRDVDGDVAAMEEHSIPRIDLVAINLYPFEETVAGNPSFEEAIEQIDIGGPAMVRAAAKNHAWVTVVVDPGRYDAILSELRSEGGATRPETRRSLAMEAYRRTAAYDSAISNWFGQQVDGDFPDTWTEQWQKVGGLRYGENPHQQAAWYRREDQGSFSLAEARVLGGKALSYNNLLDAAAAIECAASLDGPGAVVVKHCLPCGASEREQLDEAFTEAVAGDPVSAFGGILAFNRPVDAALAARIATPDHFFEVIHAPRFEAGAEEAIRQGARWGKNCRILEGGERAGAASPSLEVRSIPGALLVQGIDRPVATRNDFQVVSERAPTDAEWNDLLFAWRVVPYIRSNAILLARGRSVVGAGGGQPSRVDAVRIACQKAGDRSPGAVLASDAFFPFADGLETAAAAGVTAAIQPGGSRRDEEVIAAANASDMALVLTGERHFRH